MILQSLLEGGW
jgi:hypothetical protein